jgi:16S rRNA (guanine527-N7)-methyltransferase
MGMQLLRREAVPFGLQLSRQQIAAFDRYQACLQSWNRRLNLTTIDDATGIRRRHFLDSLTCATVTGDLNAKRLIDVGSGAGLPGLPLKILYAQLHLTLVESVTKKIRFLEAVTERLALDGVDIVDARAETLGQDDAFRECYDWAVARAVAPLNVLVEYLLPLCRIGGNVLAMKSARASEEIEQAQEAIHILGGGEPRLHTVQLPGRTEPSYLVVIPKITATPSKYPRRPGIPAKRPLQA